MPEERLVDVNDLIASSDIAALLGVTRAAVSNWKQRETDFPKPIVVVGNGKIDVYSRQAVVAWWVKRNPDVLKTAEQMIASGQQMIDTYKRITEGEAHA